MSTWEQQWSDEARRSFAEQMFESKAAAYLDVNQRRGTVDKAAW